MNKYLTIALSGESETRFSLARPNMHNTFDAALHNALDIIETTIRMFCEEVEANNIDIVKIMNMKIGYLSSDYVVIDYMTPYKTGDVYSRIIIGSEDNEMIQTVLNQKNIFGETIGDMLQDQINTMEYYSKL